MRAGTYYLRRTLLISLAILLPLIVLQFFPLKFQQDDYELHRLGWPFWYDRQFHIVFPGVPTVMWNSLWHGLNVKAIVGNTVLSSLVFVCLLAIGIQSKGFRKLLLIDLISLTVMVAICVSFRSEVSHYVHLCESALGSAQKTPASLLESSLLQTFSVTICFGLYALVRTCRGWTRTDNKRLNVSGGPRPT
jgi:hypothetical protein